MERREIVVPPFRRLKILLGLGDNGRGVQLVGSRRAWRDKLCGCTSCHFSAARVAHQQQRSAEPCLTDRALRVAVDGPAERSQCAGILHLLIGT